MNILAIETSCDETSIAIVHFDGEKYNVLSHLTHSQIETHREYGGVYPTMAKREHVNNITPLIETALKESDLYRAQENSSINISVVKEILHREPEAAALLGKLLGSIEKPNIDAIAVTQGPGLEPALWVGINVAKVLGKIWDIPVIPTNHMEGHIVSVLVSDEQGVLKNDNLKFPALALLISGGHTELVLIKDFGSYEKIGSTRDDAVGEAFDKVARLLGLPYPGGPEISRLAEQGQENDDIPLPRPMIESDDYDFSFSGLKTAVRYLVDQLENLDEQIMADIAKEFQNSVIDVLIKKTSKAIEEHEIGSLIIAGGVAANKQIREAFTRLFASEYSDVSLFLPESEVTGDNALMIAVAGYLKFQRKEKLPSTDFAADGNLSL